MIRIIIRCDASVIIGSGHVIRCRTLGRELKRNGAEILFICRRGKGDLISLVEKEFEVIALPEFINEKNIDKGELGLATDTSQEQDANECIKLMESRNTGRIDWIIVDHYRIGKFWEEKMKEQLEINKEVKLLVIDDLANRKHQANILLDQNYFGSATEERYASLIPESCKRLLGPKFAILGSEYSAMHKQVVNRKTVKRVLLFFGGSDEENLTERTIKILMKEKLRNIAIDVVIGGSNQNKNKVELIAGRRKLTSVHFGLPSLAGLIARADMAIGAGGTTTWERICLKLPTIVIPCAENQRKHSKELYKVGAIELLENKSEEKIFDRLLIEKISDPEVIERFNSSPLPRTIDGKGCQSAVKCLVNHT